MSKELAEKLGTMSMEGVDVTDANAVAQMLGYGEDTGGTTTDTISQGDTTTAATAAPALADATAATQAAPASTETAQATAAATVDSSATPAAATETASEIAGVLTKDGKHVIPHKVLQDTRLAASLQRQRADAAEEANKALLQQVEDLKAGRTSDAASGQYTAEQLAEIEADFPQLAPLLRTVESLQAKVATAAPVPPNPEAVAAEEVDQAGTLDVAIAARPLLAKYRETGGVVWARAVEIDRDLLEGDPAFANASTADRFAEVERRLASELGVPVPANVSTPTLKAEATAPAAPAPAPVAASAPSQPQQIMPTLTDLGGSGVTVGDPLAGMSAGQMVDKAMSMDMESLRKLGGLSY